MTEPLEPVAESAEEQRDPGHMLPDDEWAQVVADAQAHPDNPHNPDGGR